MSEAFEQLVISRLDQLVQGQEKAAEVFADHVKDDDERFTSIEVAAAETAGAVKQRATFWGASTGFIGVAIGGLIDHFWRH